MTAPTPGWLDLPAAKKRKSRALAVAKNTNPRAQLVVALKELSVTQRIWLKALVQNGFVPQKARKMLMERGMKMPSHSAMTKWRYNANYVAAKNLYEQIAYETDGPSKTALLARVNRIAEFNAEEVDEFHQGEPTGRVVMRDPSLALKATEIQMKEKKMLSDEHAGKREGPQMIVQVISGENARVIDVTPRVEVQRPVIEGESAVIDGDS